MRRKAPRVGDLVSVPTTVVTNSAAAVDPTDRSPGLVTSAVGIHLYVRLLKVPFEGHSGLAYVRRDSVEVIVRADHA